MDDAVERSRNCGCTALAGTYVYTPAAGTILTVGLHTLSVTFAPTDTTDYTNASQTATIQVNQTTPTITWPSPSPITYGTPLDLIQLNATATSTTPISLASYFNVYVAYTNGTSYGTGGFDGGGYSYSANSLGTSITWNGVTYPLGPSNAPDAVYGATISLPVGYYASLQLLGALVNNELPPSGTFTVTYTDGSTTSAVISLSDWVNSLNYPGETSVKCNVARNYSNGTAQGDSTCVYGYQITLNSSKIVQSIKMPNDRDIVMLAMGLTSPPVPGTFVYTPPAGTVPGVGNVTLSTTFTPTDNTDYTTATASVPLVVNKATSSIVWPTPANITYGTPLSATQLDATAMINAAMVIPPISGSYRVNAIFTDGTSFGTGGFGGTGNAYSANQLGSSVVRM